MFRSIEINQVLELKTEVVCESDSGTRQKEKSAKHLDSITTTFHGPSSR